MSLAKRLGQGALLYTAANVLQQAVQFLLLPLYTRYLTPDDYGVVAVVTGLAKVCGIFIVWGLHGAVTRFYFEYRDNPDQLRRFMGAIVAFVLLTSVLFGLAMFGSLGWPLRPFAGDIAFWPYVALGLMTVMVQPVYNLYLAWLQVQEKPKAYTLYALSMFGVNVVLTVTLVVFLQWGAMGPLVATLIASGLFFVVTLIRLAPAIQLNLDRRYLREALAYSLPLVPHNLAGQVSAQAAKVSLNASAGAAAAGLYNVGFQLGSLVMVMADSVNRAYSPIALGARKSGTAKELSELRDLGLLLAVGYSLVAAAMGLFGAELVRLFTTPKYYAGAEIIPVTAFTFAVTGVYYVLGGVLFFERTGTRVIAIGTVVGAVANVSLNAWLVPLYGLMGAAYGTLAAQVVAAVLVAAVARRFEPIRWPYLQIVAIVGGAGVATQLVAQLAMPIGWAFAALKLAVLVGLTVVLSAVAWGNPLRFVSVGRAVVGALRRRKERPGPTAEPE